MFLGHQNPSLFSGGNQNKQGSSSGSDELETVSGSVRSRLFRIKPRCASGSSIYSSVVSMYERSPIIAIINRGPSLSLHCVKKGKD